MEKPMIQLRTLIERHMVLIIPIIATCIFLNQIYRQHTLDLTVWKGGGMGMFAALDRPRGNRFVKMYITDNHNNRLPIFEFKELDYRVRVEPSDHNLDILLNKIVGTRWKYSLQLTPILTRDKSGKRTLLNHVPKPKPYGSGELIDIQSIDIEYGQIFYNKENNVLQAKTLKERHYEFTK